MIDTFLETHNCFNRLLAEYREHKKLIVAVDFDDTVFDYHQKGRTYEYIIALLRRCQKQGFWIVLFTACAPDKAESQKAYLAMRGIEVHSVNKNPIDLPFGNDGKIYFNILLDDRAGLGQAAEILLRNVTLDSSCRRFVSHFNFDGYFSHLKTNHVTRCFDG